MNFRAIYRIYEHPVRLEKVIDGLWVTSAEDAQAPSEEEFFRSATLFEEPMSKAQPLSNSTSLGKSLLGE